MEFFKLIIGLINDVVNLIKTIFRERQLRFVSKIPGQMESIEFLKSYEIANYIWGVPHDYTLEVRKQYKISKNVFNALSDESADKKLSNAFYAVERYIPHPWYTTNEQQDIPIAFETPVGVQKILFTANLPVTNSTNVNLSLKLPNTYEGTIKTWRGLVFKYNLKITTPAKDMPVKISSKDMEIFPIEVSVSTNFEVVNWQAAFTAFNELAEAQKLLRFLKNGKLKFIIPIELYHKAGVYTRKKSYILQFDHKIWSYLSKCIVINVNKLKYNWKILNEVGEKPLIDLAVKTQFQKSDKNGGK